MLSIFEKGGFTPLETDYNDLNCYRLDSIYLVALKKYRSDKKASRQSANHLDERLFFELTACMRELERDKSIKTIIISSDHRVAFSRGAKVENLLEADESYGRRFVDGARELLYLFHNHSKPIIALINGLTLGGGLELAMACDYRLAGDRENIFMGQPEGMLGLVPGMGGTVNLPRLAGSESALELLLSGRADLSPGEALGMGLLDRVFSSESLVEECLNFIKSEVLPKTFPQSNRVSALEQSVITGELESYLREHEGEGASGVYQTAPLAQLLIRFIIEKTADLDYATALSYEEEAFCFLLKSEDFREGIRALTEEREPHFKGR